MDEYAQQIERGLESARTWLAQTFPGTVIKRDAELERSPLEERIELQLRRGSEVVHVVRFRRDFLADHQDDMGGWLLDKGLKRRLEQAGANPVIVPF